MKKYIIGLIVVLIVVGLGISLSHKKAFGDGTVQNTPVWFYAGLSAGNQSTTGYSGSGFSVSSSGALTANGITNTGNANSTGNATRTGNDTVIGSQTAQTLFLNFATSSTSPTTTLSSTAGASIGSPIVASGHLVVAVGQTSQSASTTAVDVNSDVQVQLEQTTPIAGVTCNTTLSSSSTDAVLITASSTNTSLNGFQIKVSATPVTNPFCYSFSITN